MKTWKNNVTGEIFTESELRKAFEDAEIEGKTFEDWFDEEITNGRNGQDGLEEIEEGERIMKGIKRNIKVYEVGNGFLVEIDYDAQCQGHPTVDSWLWHENYGIKMSMFGCLVENADGFLEIVEANLPEYIRMYAEEYMDADDCEEVIDSLIDDEEDTDDIMDYLICDEEEE